MNNTCKFAGGGYCLCEACQSMRKAFQEAEKVTKEEIDALLKEAEESLKKTE